VASLSFANGPRAIEGFSALIWMLHIEVRTLSHQISKLYGPTSQKTVIFCATSLSISSLPCLFGFKETVRTEPVDGVYRWNAAAGGQREVFCHDRRKLPVSDLLLIMHFVQFLLHRKFCCFATNTDQLMLLGRWSLFIVTVMQNK